MRHVGRPLDFVSINDIVVQDGYVGYFDFVECFAELLEAGNIEEMAGEGKEGDEIYRVTEQGAYVVDTLDSRIINNIKEKSRCCPGSALFFGKKEGQAAYTLNISPPSVLHFPR